MVKCVKCDGNLVWDGDWETVAQGEVEDPVLLHYTCEKCLQEYTAHYTLEEIEIREK